jgi:ubiquinone/menaquinone biosynthesis C-methylase UbiE
VANAGALPFADASFDAVISNWGLPHFGRPKAAVAEMARVAGPGAKIALTAHDIPQNSALLGIFLMTVQQLGLAPPADIPPGPSMFQYADDTASATLLAGVGLENVRVETIRYSIRTTSDWLWDALLSSAVRSAAIVESQPEDVQRQARAIFASVARRFAAGDEIEVPVSVKLAAGVRGG